MGRAARDKGQRVEYKVLHRLQDAGIPAEKLPLSGQLGGKYRGDLMVADSFRAEVKARKSGEGFAVLERWLGGHDLLLLVRDRQLPLAVMEWSTLVALLRAYKGEELCISGQG